MVGTDPAIRRSTPLVRHPIPCQTVPL